MSLPTDTLVAYRREHRRTRFWRLTTFLSVVILGTFIFWKYGLLHNLTDGEHVVRIRVNGFIADDPMLGKELQNIANNKNVKALIIFVDSHGGTSFGGEFLYRNLRQISTSGKPVVAVIRTVGTSSGYAVALGADRIFALETSLIGSIGAIIRSADLTELLGKIGIRTEIYRSGKFKSFPSVVETTPEEAEVILQSAVDNITSWFIRILSQRRKLSPNDLAKVTNGRIFTGQQALAAGLIDDIGGEVEAVNWLRKSQGIAPNLPIIEAIYKQNRKSLVDLLLSLVEKTLSPKGLSLDESLSIWQAGTL